MASTPGKAGSRGILRASEVCEIAGVQSYVLRSWEAEFPGLGVARSSGGPRFYRERDVERVLQIKQLVFVDGLTLAGARRRLDGASSSLPDELPPDLLMTDDVRARLTNVKAGLRWILEQLSNGDVSVAVRDPVPAQDDLPLGGGERQAAPATSRRSGRRPIVRRRATA
jgi:DNA-binding transcriptional MerR regulator